eukprot:c1813_g1_i1.p1 GENE.c1813_g1_i1~~c1813_g1_i1.p1  ORF type:complete len:197 (-),score=41.42 c1813_g1_i1:86-676(-)
MGTMIREDRLYFRMADLGEELKEAATDTFRAAQTFYKEWKEFALRKTIFDVAVGLMVGNALSTVTNSLVTDILTPVIIGCWAGTDLTQLFIILRFGKKDPQYYHDGHYETVALAEADGAVLWKYGNFLDSLFQFFFITLAVFVLWKGVTYLRQKVEKLGEAIGSELLPGTPSQPTSIQPGPASSPAELPTALLKPA